ncbi:hypothetical protein HK096_005877 [Nowakowskiella sp. JEL0078]|nr:hypothetical protein HK096_005877 [Nowakowskiella sp. JEL0078]
MSIDPSNGISPSAINDFGSGIHSELDQRFGGYGNFPAPYSGSGSGLSNLDFDQRGVSSTDINKNISPKKKNNNDNSKDDFFTQKLEDAMELQTSSRSSRVSERRAEQNRAAQRAFRHRKNLYIKNLEAKVKHCETREAEFSALDQRCKDLQTVLETLTRERDYINWERDSWKHEREQILGSFEKMRWELSQLHIENTKLRETFASKHCNNCESKNKKTEYETPKLDSIAISVDIPPAEGCVIDNGSNLFESSWCVKKTNSIPLGINTSSTETISLHNNNTSLKQLISESKPYVKKNDVIVENCEISKIKQETEAFKNSDQFSSIYPQFNLHEQSALISNM